MRVVCVLSAHARTHSKILQLVYHEMWHNAIACIRTSFGLAKAFACSCMGPARVPVCPPLCQPCPCTCPTLSCAHNTLVTFPDTSTGGVCGSQDQTSPPCEPWVRSNAWLRDTSSPRPLNQDPFGIIHGARQSNGSSARVSEQYSGLVLKWQRCTAYTKLNICGTLPHRRVTSCGSHVIEYQQQHMHGGGWCNAIKQTTPAHEDTSTRNCNAHHQARWWRHGRRRCLN